MRFEMSITFVPGTDSGNSAKTRGAQFHLTCPMHRPATWAEMRRDRPTLFTRACALESLLNTRRETLGKDPVWLTRFNRPLSDLPAAQDMLPGLDGEDGSTCDNGACFT